MTTSHFGLLFHGALVTVCFQRTRRGYWGGKAAPFFGMWKKGWFLHHKADIWKTPFKLCPGKSLTLPKQQWLLKFPFDECFMRVFSWKHVAFVWEVLYLHAKMRGDQTWEIGLLKYSLWRNNWWILQKHPINMYLAVWIGVATASLWTGRIMLGFPQQCKAVVAWTSLLGRSHRPAVIGCILNWRFHDDSNPNIPSREDCNRPLAWINILHWMS